MARDAPEGERHRYNGPITLRAQGAMKPVNSLNERPRKLTKRLACRIIVNGGVIAVDSARVNWFLEEVECKLRPLSEVLYVSRTH